MIVRRSAATVVAARVCLRVAFTSFRPTCQTTSENSRKASDRSGSMKNANASSTPMRSGSRK